MKKILLYMLSFVMISSFFVVPISAQQNIITNGQEFLQAIKSGGNYVIKDRITIDCYKETLNGDSYTYEPIQEFVVEKDTTLNFIDKGSLEFNGIYDIERQNLFKIKENVKFDIIQKEKIFVHQGVMEYINIVYIPDVVKNIFFLEKNSNLYLEGQISGSGNIVSGEGEVTFKNSFCQNFKLSSNDFKGTLNVISGRYTDPKTVDYLTGNYIYSYSYDIDNNNNINYYNVDVYEVVDIKESIKPYLNKDNKLDLHIYDKISEDNDTWSYIMHSQLLKEYGNDSFVNHLQTKYTHEYDNHFYGLVGNNLKDGEYVYTEFDYLNNYCKDFTANIIGVNYIYDKNDLEIAKEIAKSFDKNKEYKFMLSDLEMLDHTKYSRDPNNNDNYSGLDYLPYFSSQYKKIFDPKIMNYHFSGGGGTPYVYGGLGHVNVTINGIDYLNVGTVDVTAERIIYLEDGVNGTDEQILKMVQDRIDNRIGKGIIQLEILDKNDSYYDYFSDFVETNNAINGLMFKDTSIEYGDLYIAVADSEKMANPKLNVIDMLSDTRIKSNDNTIPTDTVSYVEHIKDKDVTLKFDKALGNSDTREIYDLSLHSLDKNKYVDKTEDEFEVILPISNNLKGKDLIVYYVDDNGKVEEYPVTIKENKAVFKTNHFSTYALSEKSTNKKPQNNDDITIIIPDTGTSEFKTMNKIFGFVVLTSTALTAVYLNKKKNH